MYQFTNIFKYTKGCWNKMFPIWTQICVGCIAELSENRKSKQSLIWPARVWITLFGSRRNAPLLLINFICNSKIPPPCLAPTEARRNEWILCAFFWNVITQVFLGESVLYLPRRFHRIPACDVVRQDGSLLERQCNKWGIICDRLPSSFSVSLLIIEQEVRLCTYALRIPSSLFPLDTCW